MIPRFCRKNVVKCNSDCDVMDYLVRKSEPESGNVLEKGISVETGLFPLKIVVPAGIILVKGSGYPYNNKVKEIDRGF